ncbi:MAG TPA: ABC transporter ATP-binding protein [Firmicutes bacterium]|jgi:oligopeptide/dipeptide ABC transporter ATP-binding protein|nr:ABC transporter ATP-binding protein [Bacillota bacterium]
MTTPLITVENLRTWFPITGGVFSRRIGDVKAVDGVSFQVNRGEIFGLVGESGCGKSTIGRSILRLIKPTGGRVTYEDTVLFDVEAGRQLPTKQMRLLRRNMQIIFQDPFASLDPRMNVGTIVAEGLIAHRIARGQAALEQAQELLYMCGLPANAINKYPHEFSGGQRQRISIARALAFHPDFIVADEPIAALDVSIQAQILTLMQELKEKLQLTYLFISHDLGVVRYFCDRIAVMYLGNFVETGTSEQIFSNPLHPYTRALLSAVPSIEPDARRQRIILQGSVPSPANPPAGCKFHTRCPVARPECAANRPELRELEPGHAVACPYVE